MASTRSPGIFKPFFLWTALAALLVPDPHAAELLDSANDAFASSINTTSDEREPFLAPDGHLLLFSSNRFGAYRVYGVYFPGLPPEAPVPAPAGARPLPEMPWLGGPGDQRSPCACGDQLYYRSEADWGAGLYQARFEFQALPGASARLLLSTGEVRPLLQKIGARIDGPWWLPSAPERGILLARVDGAYLGWRLEGCLPRRLESAEELARELPWLGPAPFEALASAEPGRVLGTTRDARGRLDFGWLGASGPELGVSFAGPTVNTRQWDELEAAWGPVVDGKRLLVFSRESNPARRDANLWYEWIPWTP